jgi:aspartate/methionine/tyrosine aminotransferase
MTIRPFQLERYFARYEFNVKHLLSASDCESLSLAELLALAAPEHRQRWDTLRLGYTESQGDPELRAAIAATYHTIHASEVLVAAPEEAIFLLMQALLQPGDHVIAIAPAYQSLYELAQASGCTVTPWPVTAVDGRWHLDLDALRASLTARTRLIVVNFPHNPTGYLPTAAVFARLIALAADFNVPIFCDEMYRWLEYEPTHRLPSISDAYAQGIALSGLSKVHALPGLRIGWLATHNAALLAKIQALRDYTTICNSAPSEILALMALDAEDTIIARNLGIIERNRTAAEAFFVRHAGLFRWLSPAAGSVAFPLWLGEEPIAQVCERLVADEGVLLVPGHLFDVKDNHFRLGLGRHGFAAGLARVETWLAQHTPE